MHMTRLLSARAWLLGPTLGLALCACNTLDASTDHTIAEQRTAPPAAIVVQPFALSPEDAPPDSAASSDADKAAASFRQSLASHLIAAIDKMGLPAQGPDAALPPGSVVSLEGSFVSVPGGDSADPAIVSLANAWPDVVVDVQIYDTSDAGDRLYEDMEIRIGDTSPLIPQGEPGGEPTVSAGGAAKITPAIQAKLDAAAADGAAKIARHLAPFFADQGWIAPQAGS
jgi:hypothetical protein